MLELEGDSFGYYEVISFSTIQDPEASKPYPQNPVISRYQA
jgi:hypothetical protein